MWIAPSINERRQGRLWDRGVGGKGGRFRHWRAVGNGMLGSVGNCGNVGLGGVAVIEAMVKEKVEVVALR
ncbi:hypothetical protein Scep_020374 [Stephania cephalantha]|uniref:Uncharacterized protein n=1 Tax=Stephania cephalantha TaxID=152367 RepID=A0AAP0NP76_9MAGN